MQVGLALQCSDVSQVVTVRNSSCGKAMFYRCLSVQGGGVHPPGKHPNPGQNPPHGNCSGRYAYYWNAFLFFLIFTARNEVGGKVMFLQVSVILFTGGEGVGRSAPLHAGIHPLPSAVHAGRYGQQAGSTHPTGMQSCYYLPTKFQGRNVFSLSNEEGVSHVTCDALDLTVLGPPPPTH